MNSMISSRLLATVALCAAALVGCNAVEDVRTEPFTPVPEGGVVLQGKVTGTLGNKRSLTLMNNGDPDRTVSVLASLDQPYTVFNFGVVPVGSHYKIEIKPGGEPLGKDCTVSNGEGTITTAEALNISINCVNEPGFPRYNLRVAVPSDFGGREGAKVTLTTEEGVYSMTPANGATSVTFNNVLFNNRTGGTVWGSANNTTSTANGGINPYTNISGSTANGPTFTWTVTATTTEGTTPTRAQTNRCIVTNGSNFLATTSGSPPNALAANTAMPPVADIGFGTFQVPTVGACTFTIGGTVAYSTPPGGAAQVMSTSTPLKLDLRDVQGNVIETLTHTAGYGASGTTPGGAGAAYVFATTGRSSANSVYDVVVSQHPAGHYCVVANGGAATLGVATANITNANVFCRAKPTLAANQLQGTYGFYDGVAYNYPNPTPAATSVSTLVASVDGTLTTTTVQTTTYNTRTTYLARTSPDLGGESRGQQIQRIQRIRTIINVKPPGQSMTTTSDVTVDNVVTDTTNNSPTRNFLTFFTDGTFLFGAHGPADGITATNQVEHGFYVWNPTGGTGGTGLLTFTLITDTVTAGNNALPSYGLSGTPGSATVNGAVTATMNRVVRSTLGGRPTLSGEFTISGFTVGSTAQGARWATWRLAEPKNTDGQVEGPWVTQDHRRAWNYDNNTTLGYHVGVNGGAANLADACWTFENFRDPAGFYTRRGGLTGCLEGTVGVIPLDLTVPGAGSIPGYVGKMPGAATAIDGRSPYPIYYAVGTPATLASVADPEFFPTTETTPAALAWCTTEVFAVRASLNGLPADKAVYFCRERTN